MIKLYIKKLAHFPLGIELNYATEHSSGIDLIAAIESDIILGSGKRLLVPTGISIEISEKDYEAQIRPRSGLALKHGLTILNSPGTIDNDYRGEIKIILINHGEEDFVIIKNMRIAQMVITSYVQAELHIVENLLNTERAEGGFGSTGH